MTRLLDDVRQQLCAAKMLTGAGPGSHEPACRVLTSLSGTQSVDTATASTLAAGDV